jgi:hypothetical protein
MRKLIFVVALLFPAMSLADGTLASKYIPQAELVGKGRLSVVFWDVYDASLFAPGGTFEASKPYALSIDYFRTIEGIDIADRTIEEMRGQGFSDEEKLAAWQKKLREIFPNVTPGTNITAIYSANKSTKLFHNGKEITTINDPLFGQHFFAIWLAENTSEPSLRRQLLGLS